MSAEQYYLIGAGLVSGAVAIEVGLVPGMALAGVLILFLALCKASP